MKKRVSVYRFEQLDYTTRKELADKLTIDELHDLCKYKLSKVFERIGVRFDFNHNNISVKFSSPAIETITIDLDKFRTELAFSYDVDLLYIFNENKESYKGYNLTQLMNELYKELFNYLRPFLGSIKFAELYYREKDSWFVYNGTEVLVS